jgi:hypothetical protein
MPAPTFAGRDQQERLAVQRLLVESSVGQCICPVVAMAASIAAGSAPVIVIPGTWA